MNVVDSSGWLEYYSTGQNGDYFGVPIGKTDELVVPSITIHEVYKVVLRERGKEAAEVAIGGMLRGRVIDLTAELAIASAALSDELKLSLADAVIMATARAHEATLWTQDAHFKDIEGVKFREKRKTEADQS